MIFIIGLFAYLVYVTTIRDFRRLILGFIFSIVFLSSIIFLRKDKSKLSAQLLIYPTWIVILISVFLSDNPPEVLTIFILIIALGFFAMDNRTGFTITIINVLFLSLNLIFRQIGILESERYFGLDNDFMIILIFSVISGSSALIFALAKNILTSEIQRSQKLVADLNEAQKISKTGNWEWDMITNKTQWSDNLHEMFGVEHGIELEQNFISNLIHPDDIEEVNRITTEAIEKKNEAKVFYRVLLNGETRYIYGRGRVFYSEDGNNPVKMQGTVQDVTELKQVELELERRLEEKDILMQEIHHRVKNNLQIILSLIDLQIEADPLSMKDFAQQTKTTINAIALVHEKLYTKDNFGSINAQAYIEDLIKTIEITFSEIPDKIKITTDIDRCELTLNNAVPVSLIINEAITNSIKHAFGISESGKIMVRLRTDGITHHLQIKDIGSGFNRDNTEKSLGINMMEALANQLDPSLIIENDNGTSVNITFNSEML